MFASVKSRLKDMSTVRQLCERAEGHALQGGQREPGAEHFLLAALDLPDGSASRAFELCHADPASFKPAIRRQYDDALRSIGLADVLADEALPVENRGLYNAAASGRMIVQELAATRSGHGPLLGAHVVRAVAGLSGGVAVRALHAMGIDRTALQSAAQSVIEEVHAAR